MKDAGHSSLYFPSQFLPACCRSQMSRGYDFRRCQQDCVPHLCKLIKQVSSCQVSRGSCLGVAHKICAFYSLVGFQPYFCNILARGQTSLQSNVQLIAFSEVAMEWQTRTVLPLLLVSLPFSQPGAVQFDPSTIDSTIANYEFVFVNFYADW